MFNEPIGGNVMMLSERLQAARVARGWTVEEVGALLKLPARVIVKVERGEYGDLGAPIYRRGYLRSFARLVGLPENEVESELNQDHSGSPELVATGVMARSEYVAERYLRPATYIALTVLIALPVVWWAASGGLGKELASARSLDLQSRALPSSALDADSTREPDETAETNGNDLVRASLMPLPIESVRDLPAAEPRLVVADVPDTEVTDESPVEPDLPLGRGDNEAVLTLSAASWVEVVASDGRRLQQALLQPGEWRYRSDGPLSFTIGNSQSARLSAAGAAVDLGAHRSTNNVARVELFGNEG